MANTTTTTEPGLPKSSGDDGSKILHKNKKQRRNTIVVSLDDHGSNNYTIDKDDYDTVCEILSTSGKEAKLKVYCATEIISTDGRVVDLGIHSSTLQFLSPMVRKLEKLDSLSLYDCRFIETLPHEIRDLACLKSLCFYSCLSLKTLPDWIGDLSNLTVLDLRYSGTASLPDSMLNMKSLRCLILDDNTMVKDSPNDPPPILWKIIKNCKFLGSIGWNAYKENKKLQYALARNRFRTRTGLNAKKVNTIAPSLWPHAFQNATRPFRHYSEDEVMGYWFYDHDDDDIDDLPPLVEPIDAIYQLIKDRRESFVRLLLNRNAGH